MIILKKGVHTRRVPAAYPLQAGERLNNIQETGQTLETLSSGSANEGRNQLKIQGCSESWEKRNRKGAKERLKGPAPRHLGG